MYGTVWATSLASARGPDSTSDAPPEPFNHTVSLSPDPSLAWSPGWPPAEAWTSCLHCGILGPALWEEDHCGRPLTPGHSWVPREERRGRFGEVLKVDPWGRGNADASPGQTTLLR